MKGLAAFCKTTFGRIILVTVLLGVLAIVCISLSSNRTVDLWGLKIGPEEKDTVYLTIRDTVTKFINTPSAESSKINQKNKNGKNEAINNSGTNNGIQGGEGNIQGKNVNTGPNYGDMHVGDKVFEKVLPEQELKDILFHIIKARYKFNVKTKDIELNIYNYCNAPKIIEQISILMQRHNYPIVNTVYLASTGIMQRGIAMGPNEDSTLLEIHIGYFDQ